MLWKDVIVQQALPIRERVRLKLAFLQRVQGLECSLERQAEGDSQTLGCS